MRVQLEEERGASAILVALLSIVLFGIVAFTVDFGLAYTNTRQLQTAADAASLAAAAVYAENGGLRSCANLRADEALRSQASVVANEVAGENLNEVDRYPLSADDVICDDGNLRVRFVAGGSTPLYFGRLFSDDAALDTSRPAVAQIDVPPTAEGLRPYAICAEPSQFPFTDPDFDPDTISSGTTPYKIQFPTDTEPDLELLCPTRATGNWWTINCPEDEDNSNLDLQQKTLFGCQAPISIVSPQDTSSPLALRTSLTSACPDSGGDEDCLNANPGGDINPQVAQAWNSLLGEVIVLPVFCASPTCDEAAVIDPTGNNAKYPVYRLASVQVCGYHWGNRDNAVSDPSAFPNCVDPATGSIVDTSEGTNQANYLYVSYTNVLVSGSTAGSSCDTGLGSDCDTGLRRLLLVQ